MQQVLNDIHNGVHLGSFRRVPSVCGSVSYIESSFKNLYVFSSNKTRILKLLEFLFERSYVPYFFHDQHIQQCSGSHHRQTKIVRVEGVVNLIQNSLQVLRNFPSPPRWMSGERRREKANIGVWVFRPRMRSSENCFATPATLEHFKISSPENFSDVFFPVGAFVDGGTSNAVLGLASTSVAMHPLQNCF